MSSKKPKQEVKQPPKITTIENKADIQYFIDHAQEFLELLEQQCNKDKMTVILENAEIEEITQFYMLLRLIQFNINEFDKRLLYEVYPYVQTSQADSGKLDCFNKIMTNEDQPEKK